LRGQEAKGGLSEVEASVLKRGICPSRCTPGKVALSPASTAQPERLYAALEARIYCGLLRRGNPRARE